MRNFFASVALIVTALILGGCPDNTAQTPSRTIKTEETRNTVPLSPLATSLINAIGGWNNWQKVSTIDADVILSVWDEAGTRHINSQQMSFNLNQGTLNTQAQEGWKAQVTDHAGKITGSGFSDTDQFRAQMVQSLSTLLHRVRGPLNFASDTEKPGEPTPAKIAGDSYNRIQVGGDNSLAVAYYVDPQTNILKYLTSGADKPGEKGTITIYEYSMQPNGMMFPATITIVKIGQHSMLTKDLVIEAKFKNIKINMK